MAGTVKPGCLVIQAGLAIGFLADSWPALRVRHGLSLGLGVALGWPGLAWCDGLAGVGDPGGFPAGGSGPGAPGVVLAQQRRGVRGQNAELAGQPRLGAGGQLFAERAGPLVKSDGQLVLHRGRVPGCPLGPGHAVAQVWQRQLLEAAVQDAGYGSGAIQRCDGDLVDESVDIVPGELGGA
jgi:hypothetical protein